MNERFGALSSLHPVATRTGKLRTGFTPSDEGVGHFAGAFTLVELIVTIAVLGILASLFASGLSKAYQSAQSSRCLSNLRQLGMAAQLYCDDHRGDCFRYQLGREQGGELYWFGWLGPGPEGGRVWRPERSPLSSYVTLDKLALCGALVRTPDHFKFKSSVPISSFGYNRHLSAPLSALPTNRREVTAPANTVVFADAAQVNTFQFPASPAHPLLEEFYYVDAYELTAHFRHGGRCQVVFCDGHVGTALAESIDPRMPEQRVGRLRRESVWLREEAPAGP